MLRNTVIHNRIHLLWQRIHFHPTLDEVHRLRGTQDGLEFRKLVQERIPELGKRIVALDRIVREVPETVRVVGSVRRGALRSVVRAATADEGRLVRLILNGDNDGREQPNGLQMFIVNIEMRH